MITEMPATRRAVMRTLITPAVRAVAVQEPCCVSFSFCSKRLVGLKIQGLYYDGGDVHLPEVDGES